MWGWTVSDGAVTLTVVMPTSSDTPESVRAWVKQMLGPRAHVEIVSFLPGDSAVIKVVRVSDGDLGSGGEET